LYNNVLVREDVGMTQAFSTDGHRLHAAHVVEGYQYDRPQLIAPSRLKKGLPASLAEYNENTEDAFEALERPIRYAEKFAGPRPRIHLTARALNAALEQARYKYPRGNYSAKIVCTADDLVAVSKLVHSVERWVETADRFKAEKKGPHKGQVKIVESTDLLSGRMPVAFEGATVQEFKSFSFWVEPRYLLDALPIDGSILYLGDLEPLRIEHEWGFVLLMPKAPPIGESNGH
jgi:hypothetical protein